MMRAKLVIILGASVVGMLVAGAIIAVSDTESSRGKPMDCQGNLVGVSSGLYEEVPPASTNRMENTPQELANTFIRDNHEVRSADGDRSYQGAAAVEISRSGATAHYQIREGGTDRTMAELFVRAIGTKWVIESSAICSDVPRPSDDK